MVKRDDVQQGDIRQGDIWLVRLDPAIGSEIQKTRPAMIVSPAVMNAHLNTAIVAPLTSGSRPAGFRVPIHFKGRDGRIVLDHIRSVDKHRLVRKLGSASAETFAQTLAVLREIFAD
jgi:mRNA interferase MazF